MPIGKRPHGPKRLNPNLIVIGAVLVIIALILVYKGTHNKFTFYKISIETNIPDSPVNNKREH